MSYLLEQTLDSNAEIRIMDSTMLPVCRDCRANNHKVAKNIAAWGKNHQGWFYGFKLHASCNLNGRLTAIYFTPANESDSQQIPHLVSQQTKVAVGDGSYNASVMRRQMWQKYGCFILAPPHPKQDKKISTSWQIALLHMRPKIECVFDYLKQHLHLVTSFPRSINGYLLNYLRNLLTYQMVVGV
jgi:hypothetical protein